MIERGFSIFRDVLPPSECDGLLDILSAEDASRSRAGIRNLMSNSAVRDLANDTRLIELTRSLTGKPLIPFKATLFEKTDEANWLVPFHQDTALPLEKPIDDDGWGPSSVKEGVTFVHAPTWALQKILALRVHLDASTSLNGPLRVIPGSHHKRLRDDAEFQKWIENEPHIECTVGKGGVIAMRPLLLHASSKCVTDEPRRVLHIEYAESMELTDDIRLNIA